MATNQHTRRHVLAAMGALPVAALGVPAIAHAPVVDRAAWDRALHVFERARATSAAYRPRYDRTWAAYRTAVDGQTLTIAEDRRISEQTGCQDAGRHYEALAEQENKAAGDLIMMPAPDRPALLWKLEHLFGAEARGAGEDGAGYCAEWTNAFMADARGLLGDAHAIAPRAV